MECHLFRMLIQRYHDGELDSVERAAYENHRHACDACRGIDRDFARIFEALAGAPLYEPSSDFDAKVMARVNVSRYRVSVARKAGKTVGAAWSRIPYSVRRVLAVASIFILSISVYKPFLDFLVSFGEKGLAYIGSSLLVLRELVIRSGIVITYFSTSKNYRVAWETLQRAVHSVAAGIPPAHLAIGALVMLAMLVVIVRMARKAWKKGETHVGII